MFASYWLKVSIKFGWKHTSADPNICVYAHPAQRGEAAAATCWANSWWARCRLTRGQGSHRLPWQSHKNPTPGADGGPHRDRRCSFPDLLPPLTDKNTPVQSCTLVISTTACETAGQSQTEHSRRNSIEIEISYLIQCVLNKQSHTLQCSPELKVNLKRQN